MAHTLCGRRTAYAPGPWFNSAKFFDVECQVYGAVASAQARRAAGDQAPATLYWEHPAADKCVRIDYNRADGRVAGFNVFGVRYRQEVCEKWLRDGATIETVLENLGLANFDPEFSTEYEREVVEQYNRQSGRNIRLRQRRGLSAVLRFLR